MSSGGDGGGILSQIGWLIILLIVLFFIWYRFGGQEHYREHKNDAKPTMHYPTFEDFEKISPQIK